MSEKSDLGVSIRFIQAYEPSEPSGFGDSYVEHLLNRTLILGPQVGPWDTVITRMEYLRELDAKATKQ